jgi:hypothetical protein
MKKSISIFAAGMIAICAAGLAKAAPVITDGLAAAYEFNGNADDSSGNGNNGTVYGAALTAGRYGNADGAYSFNSANNDYIGVADSASLDQTTYGGISVVSMVNFGEFTSNNPEDGQTLVGKWGIQPVAYILYRDGSNYLHWNLNNDPDTIAISAAPIDSNTWHHVVGTADQGGVKLFVDGNLVATSNNGITQINSSANTLRIGYEESGPSPLSGIVDDVYIYNRALSEAEVDDLYTAAVPEPATKLLMSIGLLVLVGIVRKIRA